MDAFAKELAALARKVLVVRADARAHFGKARAEREIRKVEQELWAEIERIEGTKVGEDELASILVAGGVSRDQAPRWARAIVRDDDEVDDELELDPPDNCAHCGSAMRGKESCGVCGQARGTAREGDESAARAARIVRTLVATKRLELAAAHTEAAVVRATAELLDEHEDDELLVVAEALEAVWIARDDVAELFADAEELVAVLRDA